MSDTIEQLRAALDRGDEAGAAALVAELERQGAAALAYAALNEQLELSGDYAGAARLPFRRGPGGRLLVTCGLSGSGKSTLARALAAELGAVLIRSDALRKHLAGLPLLERGGPELYSPAMGELTYRRLRELGLTLALAGLVVILDATYGSRRERAALREQAQARGLAPRIVVCEAPPEVLRERVLRRRGDVSDATAELLDAQRAAADPFDPAEEPFLLRVDTTRDWRPQLAELLEGDRAGAP